MYTCLKTFGVVTFSIFVVMSQPALANVVVGGTRLVYEASKKEASISVVNQSNNSVYLVQSWIENGAETRVGKAPFVITPPLFRLDPSQENLLRVIHLDGALPQNRESLYWLNIKAIPSTKKNGGNELLIAVKNRLKLIYRPSALSSKIANEAYKSVHFSRQGSQLVVKNPTPYYISFYKIKVGHAEIKDAGTVSPESSHSWPLPLGASGKVTWQAINDFGGITPESSSSL